METSLKPAWYIDQKRQAKEIADQGEYDIYKGEVNPAIIAYYIDSYVRTGTIWEPFAGHTGSCKTIDYCERKDIEVIAYDLEPSDIRVQKRDSTKDGPGKQIDGVIFAPSYYGAKGFSEDEAEISSHEDFSDYLTNLNKNVMLCSESVVNGTICAIGRTYRSGGKQIDLDWNFAELFVKQGFRVREILFSLPDVAVILER